MVIWASLVTQLVKNHLQCGRPPLGSWVGKIPWKRDRLPTPVFLGFPDGSDGKESACNAGDLGSIPGLGCLGEGNGYPPQYSGQENSMGCIVHGITESDTTEWLSLSMVILAWNIGLKEVPLKKRHKAVNSLPCTSGHYLELSTSPLFYCWKPGRHFFLANFIFFVILPFSLISGWNCIIL